MRIKDINNDLRDISSASVKKDGKLYDVTVILAKFNGALRVVWRKAQKAIGWVFTSGRPISVSGRMIRLNGQK